MVKEKSNMRNFYKGKILPSVLGQSHSDPQSDLAASKKYVSMQKIYTISRCQYPNKDGSGIVRFHS